MNTNTTRPQPSAKAIVLFDGVCNLCNGAVNFIIDRDPAGYFQFAALQSDVAGDLLRTHQLPPTFLNSIVLVEDGQVYTHSDAAVRIARHLKGLSWLYAFRWLPRRFRDALYTWIAHNRYRWFGTTDACRLPTPDLQARFLSTSV